MTAKFEIKIQDSKAKSGVTVFDIEITREGDFLFTNHDIEYDLAMEEFGEPDTYATRTLWQWRNDPMHVISDFYEMSQDYLFLLSRDCANRIVSINVKNKLRFTVRFDQLIGTWLTYHGNAIKLLKASADLKNEEDLFNEYSFKAGVASSRKEKIKQSSIAVLAAARASKIAAEIVGMSESLINSKKYFRLASAYAEECAAYAAQARHGWLSPDEFKLEKSKELGWQIRRFVDCMEAVQAGKPWPPLEATR